MPGYPPSIWRRCRRRVGQGAACRRGKRDPARAPLEVFAGGAVAIGEGLEGLRNLGRPGWRYTSAAWARVRRTSTTTRSRSTDTEGRQAHSGSVSRGKKDAAEAAIPQSYIDATTLIGPEGFVRDRLAALKEAGVNALNVGFVGKTLEDRVRYCESCATWSTRCERRSNSVCSATAISIATGVCASKHCAPSRPLSAPATK